MGIFSPNSGASAKFQNPGDTVTGPIVEIGEPRQATKFGTNDPDTWPSGDPKMQVAITLQTNERDPQSPDDDGKRRVYVTVSGSEGGQLWAIRQAVRAAGANDLAVGGVLTLQFTGTDPASKNPANPRKVYRAQYQAPVGGGVFGETQQAAQQQPVQQQPAQTQGMQGGWPGQPQQQDPWSGQQAAPAQQPQQYQAPVQVNQQAGEIVDPAQQQQAAPAAPAPAPAAGPQVNAQQIQQLLAAGLEDGQIAAATGATFEQIAAVKNLG